MLGKHAARTDSRRFILANYTSAQLPAPPASCNRTDGIVECTATGNRGENTRLRA